MNIYLFHKISALIIFVSIHFILVKSIVPEPKLHYLEPGDSAANSVSGLCIFCHKAKTKYLIHTWRAHIIHLNTDLDHYDLYDGKSPTEVIEKHDVNQRSWKFSLFSTRKSKYIKINPFEDTCIGVYTYPHSNYQYKVSMTSITTDVWQVLVTALGFILFWSAPKLSRNPLFYYVTGIIVGVTFSLLILIWFISKLFGQGKAMYLMVGTGWLMSTWLARIICDNAQLILVQYREYVISYLLLSSLISFLICYRIGPVTNTRTKQIIQWFLQASGMAFIYFSSYFTEAALGLCILCFLMYNFPIIIFRKSKQYWKKMFPERQKLLTDDEYRIQGIKETEAALKNLKEYCSSPESHPWKTVLRLKEPIRFAKFMDGESHLSEDETIEHDFELTKLTEECEFTEDECD